MIFKIRRCDEFIKGGSVDKKGKRFGIEFWVFIGEMRGFSSVGGEGK